MTYEETIDKIHSFGKFGSKLGLERMAKLMSLLGNPEHKMKIIHVAGTNGKGSVCRYLYSILQENGYKAGLYTSPYLERFTERIEFNGAEISPEDLTKYTEIVLEKAAEMVAQGDESPTEFELITAIGFLYFADRDMDFLLLEVGLGGTGDSTNVIKDPVAAVITSISYDHMEYLGDSLEKIAIEKSGIIKPGVPVIFSVKDEGAAAAIQGIARERGSQFYDVSAKPVDNLCKSVDGYTFDAVIEGKDYKDLAISMIGMHQVSNAVCALTVAEVLQEKGLLKLDREKVYGGMKKAKQTGRLEIIQKDPYIIIDGAHNEAGAEALAMAVKEHLPNHRILMVIGMLADKKIDGLIEQFGAIGTDFVATEPDNPRKLSAEALCKAVSDTGKNCIAIPDIEEACKYAGERLGEYDAVVFGGSLYLIGKVRGIVRNEEE